jgi:hypothetical protein
MLDMLRIVVAGTLLYGATAFTSPAEVTDLWLWTWRSCSTVSIASGRASRTV